MCTQELKRHDALRERLLRICAAHDADIQALPRTGPRGGGNARTIRGWSQSPHPMVSRYCPVTMPYWIGYNASPSKAIPSCVYLEAILALRDTGYIADDHRLMDELRAYERRGWRRPVASGEEDSGSTPSE